MPKLMKIIQPALLQINSTQKLIFWKVILSHITINITYVNLDQKQCLEFFTYLNSTEYLKKKEEGIIQFMIKVGEGVHCGYGVFVMSEEKEAEIRKNYENGDLCGIYDKDLLAQQYLGNILILNGVNKFDFRVPVFVASTNPLIAYMHDGYLRVSLRNFDPKSKDVNILTVSKF